MHLHLFIIALALLLSVATSAKTVQEIIEDNEVKAFAQHMEKEIGKDRLKELLEMSVGKKKTSTFLSEQLEGSGWWDKDKEIEVADGQGVVKFMKGAELLDKMRKQESFAEKVMQSADGRLISEDSGKITLDELEKSEQHQHLKAFMALGRFGHIMLRSVGYAEGNVTNIKTSPRYMPPSDAVDTNHKIPNLLILSVDNGEHYELEFEFDLKYLRGFAMVAGWRLDKKGAERAKDLVLPAPEMEPVLFGYRIKDLEDFSKKFGSLLVIMGIVSYFSGKYFEGGATKGKDKKA